MKRSQSTSDPTFIWFVGSKYFVKCKWDHKNYKTVFIHLYVLVYNSLSYSHHLCVSCFMFRKPGGAFGSSLC